MTEAGSLGSPPRDSGDLDPVAAAMLELLLGEVQGLSAVKAAYGNDHLETAARRVAMVARLTPCGDGAGAP